MKNFILKILTVLFFPFTLAVLYMDSLVIDLDKVQQIFLLIPSSIFLLIFLYFANKRMRILGITMILVSYIGEILFCKVFGLYTYRMENIPYYVPLGHAIVYLCGLQMTKIKILRHNKELSEKILMWAIILLFSIAIVGYNDLFTLLFGICFFILIMRKKERLRYYSIAIYVFTIEIIGTQFGCWKWDALLWGFLPVANPPLGAVFFYAGGDKIIEKIANRILKRRAKSLDAR